MNIYNFKKIIKKIGKHYYITQDKIKIEIGINYNIYIITINKKTKKYYIFKIIINNFNKNILYITKKYIKKTNKFLNNNKYKIIKIYKK